MKKKPRLTLFIILAITFIGLFISLPTKFSIRINKLNINTTIDKTKLPTPLKALDLPLKTGLDIQGGSHIIFQADTTNIPEKDRLNALESTKNTIERRINLLGVSEATVQTSKIQNQYRLIVELPGISDVTEAISLIGQTAQLEFRKPSTATSSANLLKTPQENTETNPLTIFTPTDLTGADLVRSSVNFDPNTGKPVVAIEFNSQGTKKFAQLTTELLNKQLAIFLDNELISAPVVNTPITTGQAIITGDFTTEQAKQLSVQLNAGALPLSIKLISQNTVGATLGQDTVQKSINAGLIGLALVMGFMFTYYGKLGLLANIGLIIYGIITLALYKIFSVTLTLPGIAGFILSVGMAVDANILIFERYKEEIRQQRHPRLAIELAFGRAWDSIRDANICTLIACFILFNPLNWSFLNISGPIRGFALTLALGIFIGLFTGVIVTRNLIRVFFIKKRK